MDTPAEFRFRDGTKLHGIYHGTSDIMDTRMWKEPADRDSDWSGNLPCQHSDREYERCVAISHYGGGFWWWGDACRQCMVFIGPHDPREHGDVNCFFPDWAGPPPALP